MSNTAKLPQEQPKTFPDKATPQTKSFVTEKGRLLPLIQKADLKKVAIFSGNLDPDGLASAFAMETIIQKLGGESHSFYKGTFNRPQNKFFRALLSLNVSPEEKFDPEGGYTTIISVDAPASLCPVQPDFVIDHHEQSGLAKIASDIRLIGSSSALLWEYCNCAGVDFSDEIGQKLATALLIGIVTDTKNGIVESASELDYQALAFCHQHKDTKLYKEIINYPKPAYYNDLFCTAWHNKTIEGTFLISGVGPIPEARSGILSDLAEKFAEVEGVSTAVIFGIVDNNIDISIRSSSKINVDDFIKTAFGPTGGGKPGAGRAKIELPLLFQNIPDNLNEEMFAICFKIVKHKVLQIAADKK